MAEPQKKRDWAGLVKVYYELGVSAMDGGDLNHAQLWLHRADTIYSADDTTYEKVGDKLTDDCSDRIGTLEDEEGLVCLSASHHLEMDSGSTHHQLCFHHKLHLFVGIYHEFSLLA